MSRFYFHIIAESTLLDDEGVDFGNAQDALRHARVIAAELAKTTGHPRAAVVVESESDGGMFEVPLSTSRH